MGYMHISHIHLGLVYKHAHFGPLVHDPARMLTNYCSNVTRTKDANPSPAPPRILEEAGLIRT